MNIDSCIRCGADDFVIDGNNRVCQYCLSKYEIVSKKTNNNVVIDIQSDIDNLLKKCAADPTNALRYAKLVLDLDPLNAEALQYFNISDRSLRR